MKSALGIILISATLTTIVLGGFIISHNSDKHTECPIAALSNNGCANIMNPFEFAISHIKTIVGISMGISISPLILLSLVIITLFALSVFAAAGPPQKSFSAYVAAHENLQFASTPKLLGWLSVLEKRDPLIFTAAKI